MSAKLDSITSSYDAGQYEKLAADKDSDNLKLLIGAQSEFAKNEFKNSDELFESFNHRNIDPTATSIWVDAGKLVAGQMAGDYKPYMMDYLFVSYYQLWDAMATSRDNDARVIINQSYERQKKMADEYKSMISERQKSLPDGVKTDTSKWTAYNDIMNPALMYLGGLFYLNQNEFENARQYFARASGMVPNNTFIKSDLNSANQSKSPNHIAWIFIETGFAPRLHERRVDIPWPIGNNIQVISLATTEPVLYKNETVPTDGQLLADTNAMFITEYRQYQINDALRTITKTASNVALQNFAGNQAGGWGSLIASIYTITTTNADIRSWVTLPGHIYLRRVQKDKSGLIKLNSGDTINVEFDGNHLIYIRGNDIKQIKLK